MIYDTSEYPPVGFLQSQKDLVWERDWDLIVVLDACRWDALNDAMKIDVPKVKSVGTSTPDWIEKVWCQDEPDFRDVDYISGNATTTAAGEEDFYGDADLFEHTRYCEAWRWFRDDHVGVPRPVSLYRLARRYDPPMVVHFVQPHIPFVGDFGMYLRNLNYPHTLPERTGDLPGTRLYRLAADGQISIELIREAYRTNLEHALTLAVRLCQDTKGKAILTSDHGEMLGPDDWGHASRYGDNPQVRIVPWVEHPMVDDIETESQDPMGKYFAQRIP